MGRRDHGGVDRLYDIAGLDALVAIADDRLVGVLSYFVEDDALGVVSCDANPSGRGGGWVLASAAVDLGRRCSLRRVWATTTDDNLAASGSGRRSGSISRPCGPGR